MSTGILFIQMKVKYKCINFFINSFSLLRHVLVLHLEWPVSGFRPFTPGKGPVYP